MYSQQDIERLISGGRIGRSSCSSGSCGSRTKKAPRRKAAACSPCVDPAVAAVLGVPATAALTGPKRGSIVNNYIVGNFRVIVLDYCGMRVVKVVNAMTSKPVFDGSIQTASFCGQFNCVAFQSVLSGITSLAFGTASKNVFLVTTKHIYRLNLGVAEITGMIEYPKTIAIFSLGTVHLFDKSDEGRNTDEPGKYVSIPLTAFAEHEFVDEDAMLKAAKAAEGREEKDVTNMFI